MVYTFYMIEIKDVVRTYRSGELDVRALKGVSITIANAEFVAIAGPSGSGKTTLLNLIGCIDKADGGTILINGDNVGTLARNPLALYRRRKLGFVFQSFNLIPVLTAYENVALALQLLDLKDSEVKTRSLAMLKEVGLEGLGDRLPSRLSGGQQQRVAVARALVKQPSIVLADEPSANLDSETGKAILELMRSLNRQHGTTFIFSTHDPMVMAMADRLVKLHDGLVQSDTGIKS